MMGEITVVLGHKMFFKARLAVGVMEVQSQGYDRWRCFSGRQLLKEWSLLHCMAVQHSAPVQESARGIYGDAWL